MDEVGTVASLDQRAAESPLKVGDVIVRVDPVYFRPAEVETLLGDASRARQDSAGRRRSASPSWSTRWPGPTWCLPVARRRRSAAA